MQFVCAILLSVANPDLQYFSIFSYKRKDFREKKVIERETCVFISSTAVNLKHFLFFWASYDKKYMYWSSCQVPLFLSDLKGIWIFSTDFRKVIKYQISWISSSGSRNVPCERTDRQTDNKKLIISFRNFAKAPKIEVIQKVAGPEATVFSAVTPRDSVDIYQSFGGTYFLGRYGGVERILRKAGTIYQRPQSILFSTPYNCSVCITSECGFWSR